MRASVGATPGRGMRPASTSVARFARIMSSARGRVSGRSSVSRTVHPWAANTCASAWPMVPAPTMATFRMSDMGIPFDFWEWDGG